MCNPTTYLCHHRQPPLYLGCPTHPSPTHRNNLIPLTQTCKLASARGIIVSRPENLKVFCQRCRDRWGIEGLYGKEVTESVGRVDEALKGTEFKLTGREVIEGLRKADELFREEGL